MIIFRVWGQLSQRLALSCRYEAQYVKNATPCGSCPQTLQKQRIRKRVFLRFLFWNLCMTVRSASRADPYDVKVSKSIPRWDTAFKQCLTSESPLIHCKIYLYGKRKITHFNHTSFQRKRTHVLDKEVILLYPRTELLSSWFPLIKFILKFSNGRNRWRIASWINRGCGGSNR